MYPRLFYEYQCCMLLFEISRMNFYKGVDCDSPSSNLRVFKVSIKDFTKMPIEARALLEVNRCVVPSKICFLGVTS